MDIAEEVLTTYNDNPDLFKKIISRDVYGFDIKTYDIKIIIKQAIKSQDRKKHIKFGHKM